MADAEVPAEWSQVASDIMVSKYFRKAGVPQFDQSGNPILDESGKPVLGPERSARQVIGRLTGGWRHWGESNGYFATASDAKAFEDELAYMLVHQMAAPNSPQWFNTGLAWAYGITGPAQGHYFVDPADGQVKASDDAYTRPQPHACFIQSANDSLVEPGGLMDLWVREARIFKYGSGTGTNFSAVRGEGEPLSGGGTSSGLMSFLRVGDRAAGAIKSGGTTRRAAKMVIVDVEHPDVEKFINWKVDEEKKVAALIAAGYSSDFNGEAYSTVSGQNSNNSVRVSEAFLEAVDRDEDWQLRWRNDPSHISKTVKARDLWRQIAEAAWQCADPGLQFDTTINDWHTCPEAGRINASNPCSEYMFLDNTACNLASLNLLKFLDVETGEFDVEAFRHAVRLWTIVLEISVLMAQFPSEEIARLSYDFRTLGLGYANLGTVLMLLGMPYDSDQARAYAGAVTALMTGESYAASAELASYLGPFPGFAANREHMLRVIRNHRRAAYDAAPSEYERLSVLPMPISADHVPGSLLGAARDSWDRALALGEQYGYRNAQTTLLAPTGTIGLLMDCDTTGVEPDFALVKFKKLAGGGYFKIANQSLQPALRNLGYSNSEIHDMLRYVLGTLSLEESPNINRATLKRAGFTEDELHKIEESLPAMFELSFAFSPWTIGAQTLARLGIAESEWQSPGFNLLQKLGFTKRQIIEASDVICGRGTVEGAPHLKPEHLPVFDCANKCGRIGVRYIPVEGHIRMMAAAQPFISGAISKTINLPNEATVEDIKRSYELSWKLGLKANALYRDGSKLSQPLNIKSDEDLEDKTDAEDEDAVKSAREEIAKEVASAAAAVATDHGQRTTDKMRSDNLSPANIQPIEKIIERIVERPLRRRLPDTRNAKTHKFDVQGHEGYITVGLYDDGSPGEVFITMAKEGSTIGGLMDTIATLVSVSLQYGVPVDSLVRKFEHVRFEPSGMTRNSEIPFAKSLVDYIFRWLAMEFVPGYRAANAPKRNAPAKPQA